MSSHTEAKNLEEVPSNTNHGENANGTVNGTNTEKPKSPSSKISSDKEENGFEHVGIEEAVPLCPFSVLMEEFRRSQYNNSVIEGKVINEKCAVLFERDYNIEIVKNDVCVNYPTDILVPLSKKEDKETNRMGFNAKVYTELINDSKLARLRCRFVTPVILFDDKFICRSGALCVWTSAVYEHAKASIPSISSITDIVWKMLNPVSLWNVTTAVYETAQLTMSDEYLKKQYGKDAKILEHLKTDRICDLMVEYYKHFKGFLYVSSTEKNHEEFYKDMKIEEMPYPGCEFFTQYFEAERIPDGLLFDWAQIDVKRTLTLTENPKFSLDTGNFKEWDLVRLTQNYLKIILSNLLTETGGILVHCISGWDRTPLFISLIRLSLWADGVIHKSLNYEDMAFLTVAYDWYLFGHNLPDRLAKKEEIMHFCFNFLQYITSDDFSITRMFLELDPDIKKDRKFPEFVPGQRKTLNDIRNYVMESYKATIISKPENE